jgi:hypothetical protein
MSLYKAESAVSSFVGGQRLALIGLAKQSSQSILGWVERISLFDDRHKTSAMLERNPGRPPCHACHHKPLCWQPMRRPSHF